MRLKFLFFIHLSCIWINLFAQKPISIAVNVAQPIAEIQPTMWGIFFEDINFAADGGVYAEMVKNRSFEFENPLMGWLQPNTKLLSLNEKSGTATVLNTSDNNHFARIEVNNSEGYILMNEGFRGMGVQQGATYHLSCYARKEKTGISNIRFQLEDSTGKILAETNIQPDATNWKKYSIRFQATATEAKATLKITFEGKGSIDLDMISIFPEDTWRGRPGGLRKDLIQLLADLKPGFLRFPGGCIVEGRTLEQRYQWKKTLGSVEDRTVLINRWNTEFAHRPAPDYFQSFGLGFYEYFQMAEDIGAEPLPILSCGMACQFNTAELIPMDELDPYVQDALDLIEFANGSKDSAWGKIRMEMGHPEPFNLKYIGVGNEQWGHDYIERYQAFYQAIKAKYPNIKIISSAGPFPEGEYFDYANTELKKLQAEIVDEHYYRQPQWFFENAARYDNYDRNSFKIFAGEYAAQSVQTVSPDNKNNWECALSEAAFMTGLERNADVVHLSSYAPLFAHVDGWQWTPDLIWFDNLKALPTANYFVQQLFSNYKGTHILRALSENKALSGQHKLYASAVLDTNKKEVIVKMVNAASSPQQVEILMEGAPKLGKAQMMVLRNDDLKSYNTLEIPNAIVPTRQSVNIKGKKLNVTLEAYTLAVVRVSL